MGGPLGVQRFDFDDNPELLLGDQTEIVRERTGMSALQWLRRLSAIDLETADEQDFLVVAFLARYRQNPLLEWPFFVRTVAPMTIQFLDDGASAPEPAAEPEPAPPAVSKPRAPRSRKSTATT